MAQIITREVHVAISAAGRHVGDAAGAEKIARQVPLGEGHLPAPGKQGGIGQERHRELPRKGQHPPARRRAQDVM